MGLHLTGEANKIKIIKIKIGDGKSSFSVPQM